MLNYHLQKVKGKSLYENLYECLKQDILEGRLESGSRLPSKREMAQSHGISVRTVMNAYDQLLAEGYIISREKRGYYVAKVYEKHSQMKKIFLSNEKDRENLLVNFSSNHLVYDRFPFSMWKKVMREVLTEYEIELIERADCCGVRQLREAIAFYLGRAREMDVSAENIVIGSGVESLYGRLFKILPKDAIYAAETPGYRKIPWIYEDLRLKWCSIEMDKEGISMESLRKSKASIIHVSPEHHYPLGVQMSEARKRELLEWEAESPDHYILEDDYDCEFRYRSQMNQTLQSMDRHHRVIYMNTFGKTLAPGIRISYMFLPEKLMEKCRTSAEKYANPVPNCEQYTMAKFLNEGYFERHLRRMKSYCRESGQQLIKLLEESSLPIQKISGGDCGTHLLVKLDTDLTDMQIRWAARQRGVGVSCLSQYCSVLDERYHNTLVITYSNVDLDVLEEAVRRLEEIF